MVNLRQFLLKTDTGERTLFISPVCLQAPETLLYQGPAKAYVYEGLIKEDWWSFLGRKKDSVPIELQKERDPVIKHDQDFEQAYLGYLIFCEVKNAWQWKGSEFKFNSTEIKELEDGLLNLDRSPNS